jgi:hypothetical protein
MSKTKKLTVLIFFLALITFYSSTLLAQEEEINTLTQDDLTTITGNVQRPNGVIQLDGKLYIACSGDWTIYEVDLESQTTVTYIYGVRNSHTMIIEDTADDQVTIWAPDFVQNSLLRVNPVRSPETIASNLEGPWGIATLDQDTFLVTSTDGNRIVAINKSGNVLPIATELRSPTGIAVRGNHVYFANSGSARRAIEWLDLTDVEVRQTMATPTPPSTPINVTPAPLVSGLQNVTSVVLGPDDLLYFAYSLGTRGVVGRIDPELCAAEEEGCTNDEVEIVLYTELTAPLAGLTISPDMLLYTHTMFRPEIYQADLNGL